MEAIFDLGEKIRREYPSSGPKYTEFASGAAELLMEVGLLAATVEEVEVEEVVAVFEEDLLAGAAWLGDLIGYAFSGDSCDSCDS